MNTKHLYFFIIVLALVGVMVMFTEHHDHKHVVANSRDFVAWMQTVPNDTEAGSGLKYLIQNINPDVDQASADSWITQINAAAQKFPQFCNSGNEDLDKKEFAAFMSIVGAETSFESSNGFPCTVETGCPDCDACSYDTKGKECETNPNLQYYGRGPLQISWDYNYYNFSQYYFNDPSVLINNPDQVTASQETCWASAIWFWMTTHQYGGWCMPPASWPQYTQCNASCYEGPVGCSESGCTADHWLTRKYESCHLAILNYGNQGMGTVINLINGGYDCCPSSSYRTQYGHVTFRVWWHMDIYQKWTGQLPYSNLDPVPIQDCPLANNMNCGRMDPGPCYDECCM